MKNFNEIHDILLKTNIPSNININLIELTSINWLCFIPNKDKLSPDFPISPNTKFALEKKINFPVSINGQTFFNSYTWSAKNGKQTISVDNFFFITFDKNLIKYKIEFQTKSLSNLKYQYIFLKELFSFRTFKLGSVDFCIFHDSNLKESGKKEISSIKIYLENIETLLGRLSYAEQLFDYFEVKTDPQITDLTENDLTEAENLYNLLITKKFDPFNYFKDMDQLQPGDKRFFYTKLLNLHFVCAVTLQENRTCSYVPINKNSSHTILSKGKEFSFFEILSAEKLAKLDNIPYEILYSFFQSLPQLKKEAERVNFFALKLILVSDLLHNRESSNEKRIQLLSLAKKIEELLFSNDKSNINYKLNLIQISARISEPTNEIKKELKQILSKAESLDIKCGALILLKRFPEANRLLDQLSKKEKNYFKQFPIYSLLKNADLFFKPNAPKESSGTIKLNAKKV